MVLEKNVASETTRFSHHIVMFNVKREKLLYTCATLFLIHISIMILHYLTKLMPLGLSAPFHINASEFIYNAHQLFQGFLFMTM